MSCTVNVYKTGATKHCCKGLLFSKVSHTMSRRGVMLPAFPVLTKMFDWFPSLCWATGNPRRSRSHLASQETDIGSHREWRAGLGWDGALTPVLTPLPTSQLGFAALENPRKHLWNVLVRHTDVRRWGETRQRSSPNFIRYSLNPRKAVTFASNQGDPEVYHLIQDTFEVKRHAINNHILRGQQV